MLHCRISFILFASVGCSVSLGQNVHWSREITARGAEALEAKNFFQDSKGAIISLSQPYRGLFLAKHLTDGRQVYGSHLENVYIQSSVLLPGNDLFAVGNYGMDRVALRINTVDGTVRWQSIVPSAVSGANKLVRLGNDSVLAFYGSVASKLSLTDGSVLGTIDLSGTQAELAERHPSGDVIIAGGFNRPHIARISSNLSFVWRRNLALPTGTVGPVAMDIGPRGHIVVADRSAALRIDGATGLMRWSRAFETTGKDVSPGDMRVDTEGNAFIACLIVDKVTGASATRLIKLGGTNGAEKFSTESSVPTKPLPGFWRLGALMKMEVAPDGTAYIARSVPDGKSLQLTLSRYDAAGNLVYTSRRTPAERPAEYPFAIYFGGSDGIIVAGSQYRGTSEPALMLHDASNGARKEDVSPRLVSQLPTYPADFIDLGDDFINVSDGATPVIARFAKGGALRWRVQLSPPQAPYLSLPRSVRMTRVFAANGLIIGCSIAEALTTVFALNPATGSMVWQRSYRLEYGNVSFIFPAPHENGTFTIGFQENQAIRLASFSASNGELRFFRSLPRAQGPFSFLVGTASGVDVFQDANRITAVGPSGATLWSHSQMQFASLGLLEDRIIGTGWSNGKLVRASIDAMTGNFLWKMPLPGNGWPKIDVANGRALISNWLDGQLTLDVVSVADGHVINSFRPGITGSGAIDLASDGKAAIAIAGQAGVSEDRVVLVDTLTSKVIWDYGFGTSNALWGWVSLRAEPTGHVIVRSAVPTDPSGSWIRRIGF